MFIQRKTTLNVATDFSYFNTNKPHQLRYISCQKNKEFEYSWYCFLYLCVLACLHLGLTLDWKPHMHMELKQKHGLPKQIKVTRRVSHSASWHQWWKVTFLLFCGGEKCKYPET